VLHLHYSSTRYLADRIIIEPGPCRYINIVRNEVW
jgi:hypothetical protein